MTEGVFPKVDGDILYASEANNFYKNGYITAGSFYASTTSGTAIQDIGSFVIPANTLGSIYALNIGYSATKANNSTVIYFGISGTTGNNEGFVGAGVGQSSNTATGYINIFGGNILGNFNMSLYGNANVELDNNDSTAAAYGARTLNNVTNNVPLVCKFRAKVAATDDAKITYLCLQGGTSY